MIVNYAVITSYPVGDVSVEVGSRRRNCFQNFCSAKLQLGSSSNSELNNIEGPMKEQ